MPRKHAAVKQIRKDRKRTLRNQAVRSSLKTLKKQMRFLVAQQKRDEALRLMPVVMRRFDQAAAKGIIHVNAASRVKRRLMRQLARDTTAQSSLPAPPAGSQPSRS